MREAWFPFRNIVCWIIPLISCSANLFVFFNILQQTWRNPLQIRNMQKFEILAVSTASPRVCGSGYFGWIRAFNTSVLDQGFKYLSSGIIFREGAGSDFFLLSTITYYQ